MTNSIDDADDALADMGRIGKVTVLIPTLNEAAHIEETISSLRNQNVALAYPDRFEIVVVDSYSEDGTVEIASRLADRVIMAFRGKLTAIDAALRQVDGDIVVATDGDSIYRVNFLNLLLRHFEDPDVVAVTGSELIDDNALNTFRSLSLEGNMLSAIDLSDILPKTQKLQGRGSAYRRDAYFATGGFDLSIDQTNLAEMIIEEEIGFWGRLKKVGKCVREMRASVRTGSRRLTCATCATNEQCAYCEQVQTGERF
jgi:glycosyltransferase involved in cell wall biosynthesis